MAVIELTHVGFEYVGHGRREIALDDVHLTIENGQFVCVLGASGCGKSTLLSLIAGLRQPTTGEIWIDGRPVEGPGTDRAMVFQNDSLFPWLTALGNIRFGIRQAHREMDRSAVRRLAAHYLEQVGLSEAAHKYPHQLSGGMCQRVAIARAFAMDSDVFLLDEPFGALDAKGRAGLQSMLEMLWSGGARRKTVVFVTHDLNEAIRLADRILYMIPARVAADIAVPLARPRGCGKETAAEEDLRAVLNGLFETSAAGAPPAADIVADGTSGAADGGASASAGAAGGGAG